MNQLASWVIVLSLPLAGAQAPREPRIEIVHIEGGVIGPNATTVNGIEVTYTIEFVPANATRAEVIYLRDGEEIRSFPAPMQKGTNKVRLPHGLEAVKPEDLLSVQAEFPDGTLSDKAYVRIFDAGDFVKRDAKARARFTRLTPDLIKKKASPQVVTLSGTALGPVASWVLVNDIEVEATMVGGALRMQVPPDVFTRPGFVPVYLRQDVTSEPDDPRQSLTLAVVDPTLPALGGLASVRIRHANSSFYDGKRSLKVQGDGFARGMSIVVGRGKTPIEVAGTSMNEDSSLWAQILSGPPADDYFVAVLSADKKSLSRPFPISSPDRFKPAEKSQLERDSFGQNPNGLEAHGDLAWNPTTPQSLRLRGRRMRPGPPERRGRLDRCSRLPLQRSSARRLP